MQETQETWALCWSLEGPLQERMATHSSILAWESHGQTSQAGYSGPGGHKELNTTKQLREKAMAAHSSTLAWRIPWMEEPGGLQSMGSQRVRHN